MQGYRRHFAASIAITAVFLICALSAVLSSGPAAESAVGSNTKEADTSIATSTRAGTLELTPVSLVDAEVSFRVFEPASVPLPPITPQQPADPLPVEEPSG